MKEIYTTMKHNTLERGGLDVSAPKPFQFAIGRKQSGHPPPSPVNRLPGWLVVGGWVLGWLGWLVGWLAGAGC